MNPQQRQTLSLVSSTGVRGAYLQLWRLRINLSYCSSGSDSVLLTWTWSLLMWLSQMLSKLQGSTYLCSSVLVGTWDRTQNITFMQEVLSSYGPDPCLCSVFSLIMNHLVSPSPTQTIPTILKPLRILLEPWIGRLFKVGKHTLGHFRALLITLQILELSVQFHVIPESHKAVTQQSRDQQSLYQKFQTENGNGGENPALMQRLPIRSKSQMAPGQTQS